MGKAKEKKILELELNGKEYNGYVDIDGNTFYGFVAGDNIVIGGKERENICKVIGAIMPEGGLRVLRYAPRSDLNGDVLLFDMAKTGKVSLAEVQDGAYYVGCVYKLDDHNAFDEGNIREKDITDMLSQYANIYPRKGTASLVKQKQSF